MLQNKTEKDEMLKELLKENKSTIWFAAFFFGFIIFVLWSSVAFDAVIKDLDTGTIIFETFFSTFITGMYFYIVIRFVIDSIKIKKCIVNDTYIYQYVPINKYDAIKSTMYANYSYNGENKRVSTSTHKAKMIHVFDCNGIIVSKVEETKDLLQ